MKRQHKERSVPKKRLPAIVVDTGGAVREEKTKRRAGKRWDTVVVRQHGLLWKDTGKNQEDMTSAEKFGRYKTELEERIEGGKGCTRCAKKRGRANTYNGVQFVR